MKGFSFLLPKGLRSLGFIFTGTGFILAFIRFHFGYKPEFLERKVFALYSFYIQSKTLQVIKNQLLEEIAGILIIAGLFLIAFTKEKVENESLNTLRLKSFFIAAYLNLFFLLIALLFTFGLGFVYMLIISMGLWLVFYTLSFRLLLFRNHKNHNHPSNL
jgi:hypothetical protein